MATSARDLADVMDADFSDPHQPAADLAPFVSIGKGSFGIIFALPRAPAVRTIGHGILDESQAGVCDSNQVKTNMDVIVKRTILLGVDDNKWLENDAVWHQRIEKTFDSLRGTLGLPFVPRLLDYLPKDAKSATISRTNPNDPQCLDDWWKRYRAGDRRWTNVHGDRDSEYQLLDQILLAERIPAVPQAVRNGIIDRFAATSNPKPNTEYLKAIREHPSNDAALLRVYAGSDPEPRTESPGEGGRPRRLKIFSLLNYPLNLPSMRELLGEEQTKKAVKMLGTALAVMHFGVGCDGRDVEFVFGSKPQSTRKQEGEMENETSDKAGEADKGKENVFNIFGEEVSMWLLDFNQCRPLPCLPSSLYGSTSRMTSVEGLEQGPERKPGHFYDQARREQWLEMTVSAFLGNDPCYPRPNGNDEDAGLWGVFSAAYLYAVFDLMKKVNRDERGSAVHSRDHVKYENDTAAIVEQNEREINNMHLAMRFMEAVEEECRKRKEQKETREREAAMEDWTSAAGC